MAETREEQIARWEREGALIPGCVGCRAFYRYPFNPSDLMEPRHQASVNCENGKRPHCTCGRCF